MTGYMTDFDRIDWLADKVAIYAAEQGEPPDIVIRALEVAVCRVLWDLSPPAARQRNFDDFAKWMFDTLATAPTLSPPTKQ